jgi:hypothetical protein
MAVGVMVAVTLGASASRPEWMEDYWPAVYAIVYLSVASEFIPKFICFCTIKIYAAVLGAPPHVANELATALLPAPPDQSMGKEGQVPDQIVTYMPILSPVVDLEEDAQRTMKKYDAEELSKDFKEFDERYLKDQEFLRAEAKEDKTAGRNEAAKAAQISMLLSTLTPSLKLVGCILLVSSVLRSVCYQLAVLQDDSAYTQENSATYVAFAHFGDMFIDGLYITLEERHWYTYGDHVRDLLTSGFNNAIAAVWLVL